MTYCSTHVEPRAPVGAADGARSARRDTGEGGVNRQALSAEEIAARRELIGWARPTRPNRAYGCRPGNLFLRMEGRDGNAAPVLTGSHLDSQPTGGKFDGVYGVLAALEAVQAMRASRPYARAPDRRRRLDERGGLALRARHDGLGGLHRRAPLATILAVARRRRRQRRARRSTDMTRAFPAVPRSASCGRPVAAYRRDPHRAGTGAREARA